MRSVCSACTSQPKRKKQEPSKPPRRRPCSYAAGDTHWAGHREWLDRKSYLVSCWRLLPGPLAQVSSLSDSPSCVDTSVIASSPSPRERPLNTQWHPVSGL